MARERKTPFKAAMQHFATDSNRTDILRTCHAVLTTAMIQSALEKGARNKAAKAECYAEAIQIIEEELGTGAESSFIPRKQTVFTTPMGMPQNGGVVRAQDSRASTPTQT